VRDREYLEIRMGGCYGAVAMHELKKRSRSGTDANLLDPKGVVPLCSHRNGWVENFPVEAHRLGLAKHSWED
jgi:hypothetical protein